MPRVATYYRCGSGGRRAEPSCGGIRADHLDRRLVPLILGALAPLRVEAAAEAARRLREDLATPRQRLQGDLRQAEAELARVERRYHLVDPAHDEVKAILEPQYNECLKTVKRLRWQLEAAATSTPPLPSPEEFTRLQHLAADLSALWEAPTTTNEDRKRIIRLLLREVVYRVLDPMWAELRLTWDSGETSVIRFVRPGHEALLMKTLLEQGRTPEDIARILNEAGYRRRSQHGDQPYAAVHVKRALHTRFGLSFRPRTTWPIVVKEPVQDVDPRQRTRVERRLAILEYAGRHGLKVAGREFHRSPKTIRAWHRRWLVEGVAGLVPRFPATHPWARHKHRAAAQHQTASPFLGSGFATLNRPAGTAYLRPRPNAHRSRLN